MLDLPGKRDARRAVPVGRTRGHHPPCRNLRRCYTPVLTGDERRRSPRRSTFARPTAHPHSPDRSSNRIWASFTDNYPLGARGSPYGGVLSIWKLRVGQEAYHLSGVAQSLDDYYTGAGEVPGQWVGGGAERLGLAGTVAGDDLRAVLAGIQPGTAGLSPNGTAINPHPRRVPGFDLTFKAPKSASVLYAVSDDPRVQGAILEAGEVAMRTAIGWLEREATRVQRGSHNVAYLARLSPADRTLAGPHRLATSGVVAASFRHRTSRAGDPLLHWHVLVANLVEGTDGKWSSLVHPEIYRHATAAGHLFQATMRAELTRTLGLEWRPGRHMPEIAGIPQAVLDAFSKRSAEVEAWLEATDTPATSEGRQAAVLATRRNKPEKEHLRFDADWKAEAEQLGWGPAMADGLIAASARRHPVNYHSAWRTETVAFDEHGQAQTFERTVTPEEWITEVLAELTSERSTFTLPDLTATIAARLDAGATVETIERLARRVISSHEVVEVHTDVRPQQWTSRELLDTEQRFIATLGRQVPQPIDVDLVDRALADHGELGADQRAAVDTLATTTAAVSVLVGPAGTGKTHTIDAIRAVHDLAGIPIRGAAPSARAALELAASTGMPTTTLHRLLADQHLDAPTPGSLLVIDEAGMADIRTLTRVVANHVDAGGRVLLAGDHHQLPEIGAGGGFAYAVHHAAAVAELSVNRRQRNPWEQQALAQLRDGDIAAAVRAYVNHDRLTVADTPLDLVTRGIEHWAAARSEGWNPVLLAGTNELVDRLNQAAIAHLIESGELDDTSQHPYGDTFLRVGERVVVRRNSDHTHDVDGATARVVNGHTGTVSAVDPDTQHVTVGLDHGPAVRLDEHYLRRGGHLTHAYALTSHRAQGGTWDLAVAVGADTLHREAAYVQLSRGTHANHIILTDPEATALLDAAQRDTARHDHGITHPDDQPHPAEQHLTRRLTRSSAKHLAHTRDAHIGRIDHLATHHRYTELQARARHATYAEHLTTLEHGHHRNDLQQQLDRLVDVATHIALGQHVSPTDRHNIGTVIHIDDRDGTATLHFTSRHGHDAERTFGWQELRFVEPREPQPRPLEPTAQHTLHRLTREIETAIDAWDHTLRSHTVEPGDARIYTAATQRALDRASSRLAADQPDWLHQLLGRRPADVAGARTWDNAVGTIGGWHLTHPEGADSDPAGAHQLRTWIAQTRTWLDTTNRTMPTATVMRSGADINERRTELEQILDNAPPDCRNIIDQLQHGQLALDDVDVLLRSALDQQGARRLWILEHWPHIVEYAEIERAAGAAQLPLPSLF
jgi:conjugative relaxase-like TrwC/TraI family protein